MAMGFSESKTLQVSSNAGHAGICTWHRVVDRDGQGTHWSRQRHPACITYLGFQGAADANLIWAVWDPFEPEQHTERMRKVHTHLKDLTIHQN
ncbi:hypothetical protein OEZ85_011380 [Tetradesmus obliquus]|uniref:Uncharacterized protein n=1 Tax=Tetradesmus obliquus TaxID=3088 RepID=A0ABY8TQT5_TETOB|nr:hypothetical protein OEZ85_011380 [Tetradesmus obliquus]